MVLRPPESAIIESKCVSSYPLRMQQGKAAMVNGHGLISKLF